MRQSKIKNLRNTAIMENGLLVGSNLKVDLPKIGILERVNCLKGVTLPKFKVKKCHEF